MSSIVVLLGITLGGAVGYTSGLLEPVKASAEKLAAFMRSGGAERTGAGGQAWLASAAAPTPGSSVGGPMISASGTAVAGEIVKGREAPDLFVNVRGVEGVTGSQLGFRQAIEQQMKDDATVAKFGNSGGPMTFERAFVHSALETEQVMKEVVSVGKVIGAYKAGKWVSKAVEYAFHKYAGQAVRNGAGKKAEPQGEARGRDVPDEATRTDPK
jgi:hypothetical protein